MNFYRTQGLPLQFLKYCSIAHFCIDRSQIFKNMKIKNVLLIKYMLQIYQMTTLLCHVSNTLMYFNVLKHAFNHMISDIGS